MIFLEYELKDAGWAVGKISNGIKEHQFDISYLRDSLKELAKSATQIRNKKTKSVVFTEETGEHVLILERTNVIEIKFEFRYYPECETWDFNTESHFDLIVNGKTTISKYTNQIRNILSKIFTEVGLEEYKKKWINHEFPIKEFNKLK